MELGFVMTDKPLGASILGRLMIWETSEDRSLTREKRRLLKKFSSSPQEYFSLKIRILIGYSVRVAQPMLVIATLTQTKTQYAACT